jgi:hypothetical protein
MIHEFKSGYIRVIHYGPAEKHLELRFDNATSLAYQGVPLWIFEKICRDPSPQSFWEDNIRDEFSKTTPKHHSKNSSAADALKNLFGSP